MSPHAPPLRKVHLRVVVAFIAAFSALTLWVLARQGPSDWHHNRNFTATLLTVSGPFTGAIARPTTSDCLTFAWKLFPCCGAILALAVVVQWAPLPFQRGATAIKMTFWVIGLLGWFGGGVLSLMYALS